MASTLSQLYGILSTSSPSDVRLIAGNTSVGIYKDPPEKLLVYIADIPELNQITKATDSIVIGAGVTINRLIDTMNDEMTSNPTKTTTWPNIMYLLKRVANTQVRNIDTIGGNVRGLNFIYCLLFEDLKLTKFTLDNVGSQVRIHIRSIHRVVHSTCNAQHWKLNKRKYNIRGFLWRLFEYVNGPASNRVNQRAFFGTKRNKPMLQSGQTSRELSLVYKLRNKHAAIERLRH